MAAATFIFYLLLCCRFILVFPFYKKSGIAIWQLIALFLLKVFAGIAYAKFYSLPKYLAGSDTWKYYKLSLHETAWLKHDPIAFAKDIFVYGYSKPGNLFSGHNSYWNDLKSNVLIKIMAVMNVITFNSYYTNIILFNFIFLFGMVALFRVLLSLYPTKKYLLIATIFLLPSTLFWCSGIHKDGLILSATGLIIYCFNKSIETQFAFKRILLMLLCALLIFTLRNYVLLALIPALLCWWLSHKKPSKSNLVFVSMYSIGVILFFMLPLLFPSINLPLSVANKQNEFLQLNGTSAVTSTPLQPGLRSFISYLPTALDMAFLRPHITEVKNFSYIPAAIEVIFVLIILLLAIFFNNKKQLTPAVLFFIFFSVSILIISGYTITFSGAIVRYRSFALPLLISPLVCIIDVELLKTKLLFYKK